MTASRTRGCKRIRSNASRKKERLDGFIPVIVYKCVFITVYFMFLIIFRIIAR